MWQSKILLLIIKYMKLEGRSTIKLLYLLPLDIENVVYILDIFCHALKQLGVDKNKKNRRKTKKEDWAAH